MAIEIETLGADKLQEMWLATGEITFRDRLVVKHLPLVFRLCGRFQHQGERMDDLIRVGAMGLLKAIDNYDPRCCNSLTAFAIPIILVEITTYFRDQGWAVKAPRKLQRQKLLVDRTVETLTQQLGCSPTVAQISQATGLSQEEVHQTFEVDQIQQPLSLDAEVIPDEGKESAHDLGYPGEKDPELESLIHDIAMKVALAYADPR